MLDLYSVNHPPGIAGRIHLNARLMPFSKGGQPGCWTRYMVDRWCPLQVSLHGRSLGVYCRSHVNIQLRSVCSSLWLLLTVLGVASELYIDGLPDSSLANVFRGNLSRSWLLILVSVHWTLVAFAALAQRSCISRPSWFYANIMCRPSVSQLFCWALEADNLFRNLH
jgi:hypothetical protein